MKKIVQWLLKAMVAGILAILVASAVCLVYYNPGIHVTNKNGATDYVWQSNCFTSTMTEGIAWNRTDKNGFYNETNTDKNMDILLMGSSQMEGTNVFPKQKTAWLLENLTNKTVYNIGTSGHTLLTCVKNLETALTVMQPTEYVIIEIGTTEYSKKAIDNCLSGNMEKIPSYDSGLLFHLQRIPYLKLAYAQFKSWNGVTNNTVTPENVKDASIIDSSMLSDSYERLIAKISEVCVAHNVQPIIVYHPQMTINTDGTVSAKQKEVYLDAFISACKKNDVLFVDMTDDFLHLYNAEYVLPHGFCNTSVGAGHLNQYGHKAIAERLSEVVSDNSNCRKEVNQ